MLAYLCPQKTLFQLDSKHFSQLFLTAFCKLYIAKMFQTDFKYFNFKFETRLRDMGQIGKEGQVINLDLPNVHFLPYMDVKGVCHVQP